MANWYYYNKNDEKVGPISATALKELARQGLITKETKLENGNGRSALAGQVNGLMFPESPPPNKVVISPPGGNEVYGIALPSSLPLAEPDLFTSPPAAAVNPFAVLPVSENPFAAPVATFNQVVPQPAPFIQKSKKSSKTRIVVGAGAGILCLALLLLIGLGSDVSLTAAQQAEADKHIAAHGKDAIIHYLGDVEDPRNISESLILAHLKYFVSQGSDVNAKAKGHGSTALHWAAAWNKNGEIVKFLVSEGADVNVKDKDRFTPLHEAAGNRNVKVAEFLVAKGADVKAKDKDGVTPLDMARTNKNAVVAEYLSGVKEQTVAATTSPSQSTVPTLMTATEQTVADKILAEHGKNAMVCYLMGGVKEDTAVNLIIEHLNYYISHGADVKAKDENGQTALFAATVMNTNVKVIEFLISKGASVNAKNKNGDSPLHWVQNIETAKFLVSKGADGNSKNTFGDTPLDRAKERNNTAVVGFLAGLKETATTVTTANTKTVPPLTIAEQADADHYIEEFGIRDSIRCYLRWQATKRNKVSLNCLNYLMSKGADVNARDAVGSSPLHWASWEGVDVEVAKFLVSNGAKVDPGGYTDEEGNYCRVDSPLHRAAGNGNLELVEFLVSKGADVNAGGTHGNNNPLESAVSAVVGWGATTRKGHTDVIKFLASKGASVKGAIKVAEAFDKKEMVKYLSDLKKE